MNARTEWRKPMSKEAIAAERQSWIDAYLRYLREDKAVSSMYFIGGPIEWEGHNIDKMEPHG